MSTWTGPMSSWAMIRAWTSLAAITAGYTAACCLAIWAAGLPWWIGLAPLAASLAAELSQRWKEPVSMPSTAATEENEPRVHAVVDRLCALTGQDKPALRILDTEAPNSLVHTRRGHPPTLYVSRGLRDKLDNEQLQAVLAHEFAHLAHRDARVLEIAWGLVSWVFLLPGSVFVGLARLDMPLCALARLCGRPWKAVVGRQPDEGSDESRPRRRVPLVLAVPLLVLAGLGRAVVWSCAMTIGLALAFVGMVALIPGMAVSTMLTRRRELAADRAAAAVTGAPSTLAAALGVIDGEMYAVPTADLRGLSTMSALAIVPFERPGTDEHLSRRVFARISRTHPSMSRRLGHLDTLSRRLSSGQAVS
ncbi:MAG TPA: M48 family metalloprotease [Jiangellaceae bacterium]